MSSFDAKNEKRKIVNFLKDSFKRSKINNAVIGLSGGIDSMVSFYLLREALPLENIFVSHLYYDKPDFIAVEKDFKKYKFPKKNIYFLQIKQPIDHMIRIMQIDPQKEKLRNGNIASRMRMIALFDLAKKHRALVCGTENKSENLLGYFTRFGDAASDIEPITHLYKTQIFQLAKHLGVPDEIIKRPPSAGLWENQTDEKEMGFTYKEADQVLYLNMEEKLSVKKIEMRGFKNAKKILVYREKNIFKHKVPYSLTKPC